MVLEALMAHRGIETRPIDLFILSFIAFLISTALVSGILSGTIGAGPVQNPIGAGYLIIAFVSIPLVPLFYRLMKMEEEKTKNRFEGSFFTRHEQIIVVYTVLFVSVIISSSLVYVLMPPDLSSILFKDQEKELCTIRDTCPTSITGQIITGEYAQVISGIFQNNLKVLILAFFFSFVFGAGAIFIIAWNASVVGVLVGQIAQGLGDNIMFAYIVALPMTLLNIIPHGIFEVGAYFIGGSVVPKVIQCSTQEHAIRAGSTSA
jgi:uncharacterized membrane protein SpoIIM required for sporulation